MKKEYLMLKNARLPEGGAGDLLLRCASRKGKSEILGIGYVPEPDFPHFSENAEGLQLLPAFVDLSCRPDRAGNGNALYEETFSAVCGGFGTVLDGDPADTVAQLAAKKHRAEIYARCRLALTVTPRFAAEMTPDETTRAISDGVLAVSDGGISEVSTQLLQKAMENAAGAGLPVLLTARDAGFGAETPPVSEEIGAARAILLAKSAGCRLHLNGLSTGGALSVVRRAKDAGLDVTCGVTPFAFACTASDLLYVGTAAKLQPPLRSRSETENVVSALRDGTVDCVSSGHDPVPAAAKKAPMASAEPGAAGFQTAFGVCMTWLVLPGLLPFRQLASLLSDAPARILGIDNGIAVGKEANFTLISPEEEWIVTRELLRGRSTSTPLLGTALVGAVRHTVSAGEWL